jgi:transposase-like protein
MESDGQRKGRKAKDWKAIISRAARSGNSIRAFCRAEGIHEAQFYSWRRKLRERGDYRAPRENGRAGPASFALVTDRDNAGWLDAGIELVLAGGRRLRIGKGVDPETLASVAAVLERDQC